MVNDIEKLSQVIDSLEEQAEQVTEFNGILASVDEARSEIESSKTILKQASDGHKQLSDDIDSKLDGLLKALGVIDQKLVNLEQKQDNCLQRILDLKFLTPEQFEDGRKASEVTINDNVRSLKQKQDNCLQRIQDLRFLTPEQFEDARKASEVTINDNMRSLEQKIDKANQAHLASLKVIKIFSIFGTLLLAGSIAFLANN